MNRPSLAHRTGVWTLAAVLATSPTLAANPAPTATSTAPSPAVPAPKLAPVDIQLRPGAQLLGQATDSHGAPRAKAPVTLYDTFGRSITGTTNGQGAFGFRGVAGGVYVLQSGDAWRMCRVWPAETAPPGAASSVLLVVDDEAVLGQHTAPAANDFALKAKKMLANPLVVAGIVGGAVAIPVAIHNANDDDDPATP